VSTAQLTPSLRNLPLSILRKRYDQMTPEERKLAGFVRPATQEEFDQSQQSGGAPADFSGMVLSNPDNVQISDDTDSGIPNLRLPNGVQAITGAYQGQPQMDASNPASAQVLPAQMQTIGAKNAPDTLPADFQKWDAAPDSLPADFKFEEKKPETPKEEPGWLDKDIPLTDHWNATLQGLQNIARGGKQAVQAAYEMGKLPTNKEEWTAFAAAGPPGLAAYRSTKGLMDTAKGASQVPAAIHDINQSSDPLGTYGQVASKTAGEGAGQALTALATEGAARVTPKIPAAIENATKPALRTTGKALKFASEAVDPDLLGLASPRAAHAARLAQKAGGVASKLGAEEAVGIERDATLNKQNIPEFAGEEVETPSIRERDATRQNAPYAGEEEPIANAAAQRAKATSETPVTARKPPGKVTIETKPKSGPQTPSPSSEAYRKAPVPEGTVVPEANQDMTSLLQKSLDNLKVKKGGVMATAEPEMLTKRWGVTEESLKAGREQTRGMGEMETEAELKRMEARYRKGDPVEPVMETRDANNNIVSVDGRGRAIAAMRAGVKRIPIIVRRIGVSAP